ncbi:MAG: N-acetyldiaminopimelate deacetylase [Firmicutes bacterium ADurb.Bin506]|nr:MAG: N-acetyldiaminopimelate deacetylase [Firmicutes bacterium ADurb.Bin506]
MINSVEMADFVVATAGRVLGQGRSAFVTRPSMVGEDFAYFAQEVPGAMYLLGVGDSDTCRYPLHHSKFSFNESILWLGVRLLAQLAVDYLQSHGVGAAAPKTPKGQ